MINEITVEQLKARIDAGERPPVIDVREGWELDISNLAFARHIPMGQILARIGELDPATPLIIMCRSGGRSMQVTKILETRGFGSVFNLTGGILAWGERIDPSLRSY
ncbi:MAG: sulfurtransferase [Gammaproteobacteria bacterium]|nr:sulfurtransferase [Gammaproteobacteria bacterium]